MNAWTAQNPWRIALALFTLLGLAVAQEGIAPWFSGGSLDPRAALVMLALTLALTVLGLLFCRIWRSTSKAAKRRTPLLLLVMCAAFGAYLTPPEGIQLHWLLLPALVITGALTILALSPRPHHGWTGELMMGLCAARWLYLGGLVAATSLTASAAPSTLDLAAYALIFLGLGWATRGIGRVDQRRFPRQQSALRALYLAQTDLTLFELCLLLPFSILLGTSSRFWVGDGLTGYLALLTANALLVRLIVEGSSLEPTRKEKAVGSFFRVFTVIVLVAIASVLSLEELPKSQVLPALFSLLALGIVRGRPWGSQPTWAIPTQDEAEAESDLPQKRRRIALPLGAALLCLVIAVGSSTPPGAVEDHQNLHLLGEASKRRLQVAAGWRFRVQEISDLELSLTYQVPTRWQQPVTLEEVAAATEAVACSNCGPMVTSQEVPLGVWERCTANAGWLLILASLGITAILFGWLRPRQDKLWTGGVMTLAGLFAALALAATWGWIWTDPRNLAIAATYSFIIAVLDPSVLHNRLRGFGRFVRQGTEGS